MFNAKNLPPLSSVHSSDPQMSTSRSVLGSQPFDYGCMSSRFYSRGSRRIPLEARSQPRPVEAAIRFGGLARGRVALAPVWLVVPAVELIETRTHRVQYVGLGERGGVGRRGDGKA